MRTINQVLSLTVLTLISAASLLPGPGSSKPVAYRLSYGKLPLSFEVNQGQTDRRVKFISRGRGYTLFLMADEAVLVLRNKVAQTRSVGLRLLAADPATRISAEEELPGKSNYFIGNDPRKWRTDVPNYARVRCRNAYPGIDLVYYGNPSADGQLEHDFVVAPGAEPSRIVLALRGVKRLRLDENGDLRMDTGDGELRLLKPAIYQELDGRRRAVAGRYVLKGKQRVGFEVAAYDRKLALVIDPILSYSTYLGGSNPDEGSGIAVDSSGNAYVTGGTLSANFPTTAGAFQTAHSGFHDAFVTKLNPSASGLVYSTYLGGSADDSGLGITVDSSGNAYVTGDTDSTDFPTTSGALQTTFGGPGTLAFVTKLNAAGNGLVYSTYLGGSGGVHGAAIALDLSGNAYVTGSVLSATLPTTSGAFQIALGGLVNAFVAKLNASGSSLLYSTYLGGNFEDSGSGIAVDSSGNAYVTGTAGSTNFRTTSGAFQTTYGGDQDAFVTKLNAAGSGLVYSTYLGGSFEDQGFGIALDSSGNAYITGVTESSNFPTTAGAFQAALAGGSNAFVTKLNAAGTGLVYSTYLGGSNADLGLGIAVDSSGNGYVTGITQSFDFPTTSGAFQSIDAGLTDAFVTKLNPAGSGLVYSSYLGGAGYDQGSGIAADSSGNAYITGFTQSTDFPTTSGAFQTTYGGGTADAFVAKISSVIADLAIRKSGAPKSGTGRDLHYAIVVQNKGPGDAGAVTATDTLPGGTTFVSATPTQGACTTPAAGGTGTLTCNLGAIPAGGGASISLVLKVTALMGSTIRNTATVSGDVSDPNLADNTFTATTIVTR